jgi:hypothetical protein
MPRDDTQAEQVELKVLKRRSARYAGVRRGLAATDDNPLAIGSRQIPPLPASTASLCSSLHCTNLR